MFSVRRRFWSKVGALVLGLGCGAGGIEVARAQEQPTQRITPCFYNKTRFQLPLLMDDSVKNQLREVHLYVKDAPGGNWTLLEKASPYQTGFNIHLEKEGEYHFSMLMLDKTGRSFPADIAQMTPSLVVVLDLKGPQVEVEAVQGGGDGQTIAVDARDANLDMAKLQFAYQTKDQVWRTCEATGPGSNRYLIPAQAATTGMVRVSASDLAGNLTRRDFDLAKLQTASNIVPQEVIANKILTPLQPKAPNLPPPNKVVVNEPRDTIKIPQVNGGIPLPPIEGTPNDSRPTAKAGVLPNFSSKRDNAPANRRLINQSQLLLEYELEQVGASGVGKVEVWMTRDNGQTWQKMGEDPDCKSPVAIELPAEGVYGISLAVSNGRGFGATRPAPGDAPETWVEVDLTKPAAELTGVRPGIGDDIGNIVISWSSQDRNLPAEAVDLYFAATRDGTWQPIAKGLKSDARHRWTPPSTLNQAYIRMVARDQAGNSTTVETPQAVLLDDQSRPRGRLVSVNPITNNAGPMGH